MGDPDGRRRNSTADGDRRTDGRARDEGVAGSNARSRRGDHDSDARTRTDEGSEPRAGTDRVISLLRLAAFSLLVVGFSGWLLDDGGEIGLESPFTIAFVAGVACALASIYLGIFLANGD